MDTLGDTQENDQQRERKLAAIMFTDMVGYSTLSQENEALALQLLDRHQQIVRSILPKYSGREIETAGDSFFVEFHSAVEAAECAIEIQTTLHERNENHIPEEKIKLRIGLHLGDVVQVDDRLHGDGVNIAARLEPLAATEGICLSEDFARAVQNKLKYPVIKKSEVRLKNISEPMDIFCIQLPWVEEKVLKGKGKNKTKRILQFAIPILLITVGIIYFLSSLATYKDIQKRIAVLPFSNIGGDSTNEYFADGMTEQLITSLSNLSELNVIARSSVMKYKSAARDIEEIGKELKVGTVLDGSIRQSENKARISVQLIDVGTRENLWAMDYDREIEDIFVLQSEIAQKIARQLKVQLNSKELQKLGIGGSVNQSGYKSYLLGKLNLNRSTFDGLSESISHFEDALKFGGELARTYTGLADAYTLMSLSGRSPMPMSESVAKAKENVLMALGMDESLGEAHASLAYINFKLEWNFTEAEKEFEKAIELSPGCSKAHEWYAEYHMVRGDLGDALESMEKAYELDPLSVTVNYGMGKICFYNDDAEEAILWFDKAINLDPAFADAYAYLGEAHTMMGDYERGTTIMRKAIELSNEKAILLSRLAYTYSKFAERKKAVRILEELNERIKDEDITSYDFVPVYIGLNNIDKAFAFLNRSYEAKNSEVLFIKVEPIFYQLRDDDRYTRLLEKIGL